MRVWWAIATAMAVALGVGAINPADASQLRFFKIGSGAPGGNYFPIAGLIGQVISNPPGSRACSDGGNCGVPGLVATAQSTGGSVANVDALYQDTVDAGLSQSDVAYWAYTSTGPFSSRPPNSKICAIASLYQEQVHIVATAASGITAVDGLKGKRVALGKRDSGALLGAMLVLQAHGIKPKSDLTPVLADFQQAQQAFTSGKIDALVTVSAYPNKSIGEKFAQSNARLVPISNAGLERLTTQSPFYTASEIPADAYEGMAASVPTAAVPALLLSRKNLAPDELYAVTKALWGNPHARTILDNGHRRGADITINTAFQGVSVPFCHGAKKYYQERGLLQ